MFSTYIRLVVMSSLMFLFACGSDGSGGPEGGTPGDDTVAAGDLIVETTVNPEAVAAGEAIAVVCTLSDSDGGIVEAETWEVSVDGTGAYTWDDGTLTFTEAGDFTVACVSIDRDLIDDTPAPVLVTAGPVHTVETEVDANTSPVGGGITVTCTLKDEWGNLSDDVAVIDVEPADVGTLDGDIFSSETAGSFDIACAASKGVPKDETPETVAFLEGPMAHVYTDLENDSIPAGTFTQVTCSATDEFGNPLDGIDFEIQTDEDLYVNEQDASEVGGVKAGIWEVTCTPASDAEVALHPAELEITALEPVGLMLLLTPSKPAYQVGDEVTVGFTLVDKYDNPVPGGEIDDPTYDPPYSPDNGLIELTTPNVFTFIAEGMVLISSCVYGDPGKCDEIEAWCDGTAPVLSISWPVRGATLTGEEEVVVTGTIHEDVSSLAYFTINGEDVVPAEDGSFEFIIASTHGLNIIDAAAADVFENETLTTRSYLFSNEYIPVDFGNPQVTLADEAALVRLDDALFISDDPADENTLSVILQSLLAEMDIGALIPNPVVENQNIIGCEYDISIEDITYDEPVVTMYPFVGGIKMILDLPNFHGNFAMEADGFFCLDYVGTIDASAIHFEALIVLAVTPDGMLDVIVEDPVTEFTDLNLDLTGLSGFLLNWIVDWASGAFTAIIETLVMTQIQDLVDGLVGSLMETLAEPIVLPIDGFFEGMDQVVLQILVRFDHSVFDQEGGKLGLDLAIFSEKLIDRDPLGVMARADCNLPEPETFDFDEDAQVELGAHFDVVNEALFALWWNGMLHLDLTAEALEGLGVDVTEYGIVDLQLDTQALLPPVVTSCNPDQQLMAQVGDLYVEADFELMGVPADIHMYLFLTLGADFAVVENEEGAKEIGIEVHEPDVVLVDIAYVNDEWIGKEWMLTGLLTDTAIPLLMETLQEDPLSFAIPPISLGDLGGDGDIPLPPKDLILDLDTLEMQGAYVHMKTGFQIVDTPPPEEPVPGE